MKHSSAQISTLFFLLIFVACKAKEFKTKREYKAWIFSSESGYTQESKSEKVLFQMVHFPKNLEQDKAQKIDTHNATNQHIKEFQLRISPIEAKTELLKLGLSNNSGYEKRIHQLEFGHGKMFLAVAGDTLQPTFTHYENYRGIKNELLIHVHFSTEKEHLEDNLQIIFVDDILQTGSHEFVFEKEIINSPPKLII